MDMVLFSMKKGDACSARSSDGRMAITRSSQVDQCLSSGVLIREDFVMLAALSKVVPTSFGE